MTLLQDTLTRIAPADRAAGVAAREHLDRLAKPMGSLGQLEEVAVRLAALAGVCPPPRPEPAALAVFAGDHGVHAQGVTPWPQAVTRQMIGAFLAGNAVVNSFARQVEARVTVIDVGVAGAALEPAPGLLDRRVLAGTADLATGPAMSREEALAAVEVGIAVADELVGGGARLLLTGDMGIANTTAAAALIAAFTGADPATVTGRGTGVDDATHARKIAVVRGALTLHQPDPADSIGVLASVGGAEHAAVAGLVLGAAAARVPVLLDGVNAGAAALVAGGISPAAIDACLAGHVSAEPGHQVALARLGLTPLLALSMRLGEGTGAALAVPLVQATARVLAEVATLDAAGVKAP
jgi:nicotinate-nucleotide--dimethylbenzimidazole phosphoribosyltransferase